MYEAFSAFDGSDFSIISSESGEILTQVGDDNAECLLKNEEYTFATVDRFGFKAELTVCLDNRYFSKQVQKTS